MWQSIEMDTGALTTAIRHGRNTTDTSNGLLHRLHNLRRRQGVVGRHDLGRHSGGLRHGSRPRSGRQRLLSVIRRRVRRREGERRGHRLGSSDRECVMRIIRNKLREVIWFEQGRRDRDGAAALHCRCRSWGQHQTPLLRASFGQEHFRAAPQMIAVKA